MLRTPWLQMELLTLGDGGGSDQFDAYMRIAELTALIDGLTGGQFSARIGAGTRAQDPRNM